MNLLLVEDERKLAVLLKQLLEEERYSVDLAGDGERGQELAETSRYDAIILDVMLPKNCLLYTSPSPRDLSTSRMPSSA